ncbi:response regulator transcription factor [Candidatus Stoquefichus sp. SB1]|jgi:DNA-binding response OmpR family regulator|uniref:response regulator transcription factor n=1 Tax=Candidatus Stoquefichus sp. SB1 TaxID=1658109 RepID=UPI00067E860D|nr:response regulator transcription factor [Candidatus Stoquefichus sp. SB1]
MIKILIVEDDENIAKLIVTTLSLSGYESKVCHNGKAAIDLIYQEMFDLILLDIMLPETDGFEVMKRIQKRNIPVIFLTALQNVADKVKGLRLGAEDYIVKPFESIELLARIEVVLRRAHKLTRCYQYLDINVDVEQHIITKKEEMIALTPKEFNVFVFFLQHPDIVLTRERLLAEIWGYEFEGETRTVDIHIQQIRKKLGLEKCLVTIPKLGYRLESR